MTGTVNFHNVYFVKNENCEKLMWFMHMQRKISQMVNNFTVSNHPVSYIELITNKFLSKRSHYLPLNSPWKGGVPRGKLFFLSTFFSSKGITRENIQEDVRNLKNRGSKEKKLLKMLKDHDSTLFKHLSFAHTHKKHIFV